MTFLALDTFLDPCSHFGIHSEVRVKIKRKNSPLFISGMIILIHGACRRQANSSMYHCVGMKAQSMKRTHFLSIPQRRHYNFYHFNRPVDNHPNKSYHQPEYAPSQTQDRVGGLAPNAHLSGALSTQIALSPPGGGSIFGESGDDCAYRLCYEMDGEGERWMKEDRKTRRKASPFLYIMAVLQAG